MHWSYSLLILYIVLSQRAFLTVFNDSSQLPIARAGDLGIFYLFATGGGLSLQTDIQNLVPGTVVLYKTNESENGLKLATVMQSMGELEKTVRTSFPGGAILHVDVSLQDLAAKKVSDEKARSLGVWLRRWSDDCACGSAYPGLPRDFIKPVADIHGILGVSVPWMGLPIILLHRIKVFLAGAGIAGGLTSLSWSLACGHHVTLYDLDLDTRHGPRHRRATFVYACLLLCSLVAYFVYQATVLVMGVTCTTVVGIFFFLNAGLHDVAYDAATWLKETIEDELNARVAGPAYFGWPVQGRPDVFYSDDLSFAHAQGQGLPTVFLLRSRVKRLLSGIADLLLWGLSLGVLGGVEFWTTALEPGDRGEPARGRLSVGGSSGKEVQEEWEGEVLARVAVALRCSLSAELMVDAVVAADGYSYERTRLDSYLPHNSSADEVAGGGNAGVSPVTGRALGFGGGVGNNHLRNLLEAWQRTGGKGGPEWRSAVEEELKCPITMSRMHDPVVSCDGHSYERAAIIRWLRRHPTSPKSNLVLGSKALVTNRALAAIARIYGEEEAPYGEEEVPEPLPGTASDSGLRGSEAGEGAGGEVAPAAGGSADSR